MSTTGTFRLYVVTCYKGKVKHTVRVRAKDRRRAKLLAKRKLGPDINVVLALPYTQHMKRSREKQPVTEPLSSQTV